jgi:UDP-N-acetylglucosamine transferase subunit ALG13
MRNGLDLLVASSGGHLKQLTRLRRRLDDLGPVLWATPRSAQGESLLDGERVVWLPYVRPHDAMGVIRATAALSAELNGARVRRLISTGASPALSALPVALRHRAEIHYIESAARVYGPSVTGKVMGRVPGAECYTQYQSWAGQRWHYAGSVFDDFAVVAAEPRPVRAVVVTLGINESYGFPRLVRALLKALPPDVEVLWQLPESDALLLPRGSDVRLTLPAHELRSAMERADLVVCHAGCGSALTALEAGHRPVLVPRQARHGEHVDDHQREIAEELEGRGLAVRLPVESIGRELFDEPRECEVIERQPTSFQLRRR